MSDKRFQEPEVRCHPYRLVWGFKDDGEEIIVWAMRDGRYLTDEELQAERPSFVDTVQYQCPCLGRYPYLPCIHCRKPTFEDAVPPTEEELAYWANPSGQDGKKARRAMKQKEQEERGRQRARSGART